jgi:hypothetical protein
MAKAKAKIDHVAGKFYTVTTKNGTFIGSKEKAELFAQGKHDPAFKQIIENGESIEALAAN